MRRILLSVLLLAAACGDVAIAQPATTPVGVHHRQLDQRRAAHTTTTTQRAVVAAPVDLRWMDYTRWPDWSLWHCVAVHESDLRNGTHWLFVSSSGKFRGAFSIYVRTWQAYAGWPAVLYPHAETAPAFVQIIGARNVRARVGSSQWGGLRACT